LVLEVVGYNGFFQAFGSSGCPDPNISLKVIFLGANPPLEPETIGMDEVEEEIVEKARLFGIDTCGMTTRLVGDGDTPFDSLLETVETPLFC